ncbi:hypothetical protein [Lysinibacillus sp. 38-6]|uniref:DUF3885 domain-containing protein n=1 Tax=Lysinibacillus sp. 38-6 TaxID=3385991 RepID=UPI003908B460
MKFRQFMDTYYEGQNLVPDFYHNWAYSLHIESPCNHTIEVTYQFLQKVQSFLFESEDEVFIVVNSYPIVKNKTTYPNILKRFMKDSMGKYQLQLTNFEWLFDEEIVAVQQMVWSCKVSQIKLRQLLKALANKDFLKLRPRLKRNNSMYAPDVFIVNQRTKCIFHVYDDRGIEIMSADKEPHQYTVAYFKSYNIQKNF